MQDKKKPHVVTHLIAPMLALVLVVLKLVDLIAWPWVWVLAPLWLYYGLIVVGGTIFFVYNFRK